MSRRTATLRRASARLAIALAFAASGCGGSDQRLPTAPVSGTLAVKGKPVSKGMIYFHPKAGRPASGAVTDGKWSLTTYDNGDGAMVGTHRVAVEVTEEVPTKDGDTTTKSLIPEKFTSPDTSGIELDIPKEGKRNIEIDLVDKTLRVKTD